MSANPPPGWPQISPTLFYKEHDKAIEWLCDAFGFEIALNVTNDEGSSEHAQLTYGSGQIMIGKAGKFPQWMSPAEAGGCTQSLYMFVDDLDAHCEHARKAGAAIVTEPKTEDYGDRTYTAQDFEGHLWFFGQRVDDEAAKAAAT